MADVFGTDFRGGGSGHDLSVCPNENNTGWVFYLSPAGGSASANVTLAEADELVTLLPAGDPNGRFRARGMVHDFRVTPANGGWAFECRSFAGHAVVELTVDDAVQLSEMLRAGPGTIVYECDEHKAVSGGCMRCLA